MRPGLFGSLPAAAYSVGAGQLPQQQQKPASWLDGGKFRARDAIGLALGALGDGLTGQSTTSRVIHGAHQQRNAQQAQQQQNEALLRRQQQRANDARSLAEFRAQQPTAQQRNFAAYQGMAPAEQQDFLRYQDAVNPLGSIGPDGRFYNRPRASQEQILGEQLPDGWAIDEPASAPSPSQPLSGYNTISRSDYQRQLQGLGGDQRAMNAWMRDNNVIVR